MDGVPVPQWLQTQLKAAEGILDKVDATVTRTVFNLAAQTSANVAGADKDGPLPAKPVPFPHSLASLGREAGQSSADEGEPKAEAEAGPQPADSLSSVPGVNVTPARVSASQAPSRNPPVPANTPQPSGQAAATTSTGREEAVRLLNEQLKKRLEVLRSENEQLEDMLAASEAKAQSSSAAARASQQELQALAQARNRAETELRGQLAAQQALVQQLQGQAAEAAATISDLQSQVRSLQESQQALLSSKSSLEAGMMGAVQADLAAAHAALEAERRNAAADMAAAQRRERELQLRLEESSSALAAAQRAADDGSSRSRELQEALALAESARDQLEAQLLQGSGPGVGGAGPAGLGAAAADPGGPLDHSSELEQLRSLLQIAESGRATAEQAAAALRAEAASASSMQAALHRQEVAELQQQLREASEVLYAKQTQLEALGAGRAAAQLVLERELQGYKDEVLRLKVALARHESGLGGMGGHGGSAHDVIPMDALGEPYQRLANSKRLGAGVKAVAATLDRTAARLALMLRYPLGRLLLLLYLLAAHLYMYMLTAQLQSRAVGSEGGGLTAEAAGGGHRDGLGPD